MSSTCNAAIALICFFTNIIPLANKAISNFNGILTLYLATWNYHGIEIYGYITCRYEDHWWLAYIIDKDPQKQEVLVKFLHPAGPSKSFYYFTNLDKLLISKSSMLTKTQPTTATGRVYNLASKEQEQASEILSLRLG